MRNFHKRYDYIINQLRSLTTIKGKIVVDCACGVGDGSIHFVRSGGKVYGIDIDNKCITEGGNAFPDIKFIVGSILDVRLPDKYADIFVCSETLEHLTRKESLIASKEIQRVCKFDAYLCITVPNNKKNCLSKKLHKQYLSVLDIKNHFPNWKILHNSVFYKNPKNKKNSGNRVLILKI